MTAKYFGVLIKTSAGVYLLLTDDGSISVKESAETWLTIYEKEYNHKHYSSYEGSMSACINWMSFSPSVIPLPENLDEIWGWLANKTITSISNVSGGFTGVLIKSEVANHMWESGQKPKLISNLYLGGK